MSLTLQHKTVMITGAAHRIGAQITRLLHQHGANIVIHYRNSQEGARALQSELQASRPDSVCLVQGDLLDSNTIDKLISQTLQQFGRLDVLINNASSFYPTAMGEISDEQWDDLIGTNMKAPFFLSQAAAPHLQQQQGCILNIVDIHAERPLKGYPVYSMAKAGLVMMTKALACELGPAVRVNAIAPGAILWPEHELDETMQEKIISRTFLKRRGEPADIAQTALFLIATATYITGQILAVDGGRSLNS